jgi:hypothetical protein
MGPYAGVDYNLTLCPLQSRLQHIYHYPMPEVDFTPLVRDFGFGLSKFKELNIVVVVRRRECSG